MFKIFYKNNTECIPIILILGLLLRLPYYLGYYDLFQNDSQSVELFSNSALSIPTWVVYLLVYALAMAQAFWVNYFVFQENLLGKHTFLPALFITIFLASQPSLQLITPVLLSNFLVIVIISSLTRLQKNAKIAYGDLFNIGFYTGIGALFYFPAVILLVVLFFYLFVLRSSDLRSFFIPLLGFFLPFYLSLSVAYLTDNNEWYSEILNNFYTYKAASLYVIDWLRYLPMGILLLLALSQISSRTDANTVFLRYNNFFLIALLILGILSVTLSQSQPQAHLLLTSLPIAILCSRYILGTKKVWLSELWLWLLCISVLVFNFLG